MKKNRTLLKPTNSYRFTIREKVLIVLSIITFFGFFLIVSANMVSIMPVVSTLMIIIGLLLCVLSIPLEVGVFYIGETKKYNLESLLSSELFENFCFQNKLYTQSLFENRQINIPETEITNHGFRLKALPGIAEKILDSKEDLNNFLSQNGLDIDIVNAYAGGDGWIYFITKKNFRKDGLKYEQKL